MIKNIIIPEKIGSYSIFPERTVGFDIQKEAICATQVYKAGKKITIEKIIYEPLEHTPELSQQELVVQALIRLQKKIDKKATLQCSLSSSLVIFKELTFPFTDRQKIEMVIPYELEAQIPFTLNEAVIDFVLIDQDVKEKKTTVLVAITQQQHVTLLRDLFLQAGMHLKTISVDIIALYGLFKEIPAYRATKNSLLLSFEYKTTTIACLQQGNLTIVRSLPKGIETVIATLTKNLNWTQEQAVEHIVRFGLEETDGKEYHDQATASFNDIIRDISFTINSLKTLLPSLEAFEQIVIAHMEEPVKGLEKFLEKQLGMPCSYINTDSLFKSSAIKINDKKGLTEQTITSLAVAYPSSLMTNFNLMRLQVTKDDERLVVKQIATGLILVIGLIVTLALHNYRQISKLSNEFEKSQHEVITKLKKTFDITNAANLKTAGAAVKAAREKVMQEESLWFAFSNQTRFSFLKYLEELSLLINRQELGLNLKKLSMTEGVIEMQASVPDFKALQKLEEDLNKSNLFSNVSRPQETDFTIVLTLKKTAEENT